jgi:flavin-dependent dehydrogenase
MAVPRTERVYDVVIAGAGPAGIATALALAQGQPEQAGRILCLDRARFPREKPCGGGLTGHAHAAMAALGLAVRVPRVSCQVGRLVYGRQAREVSLHNPVDVVRREELDADLVEQARGRGIAIVEGEGLASFAVDRQAGEVQLITSSGRTLRSRVLVGADGVGSRVRQELHRAAEKAGRTRARPLRFLKAEITAPRGWEPRMVYDFSPMAEGLRGYVWLFPVSGGRINVGAMHAPSRHLSGAALDHLLRGSLLRHGIDLPGPARTWPAWPYHPGTPVAAPHLMCVGDAAGIDGLTGEGIAVALEQGMVAAAQIRRGLARGDLSFNGYARALRAAVVGRELALDRWLARLLYARRGFALWLSLVMSDQRMQSLYAARVSGSEVLADRKRDLVRALARHAWSAPRRLASLGRADA